MSPEASPLPKTSMKFENPDLMERKSRSRKIFKMILTRLTQTRSATGKKMSMSSPKSRRNRSPANRNGNFSIILAASKALWKEFKCMRRTKMNLSLLVTRTTRIRLRTWSRQKSRRFETSPFLEQGCYQLCVSLWSKARKEKERTKSAPGFKFLGVNRISLAFAPGPRAKSPLSRRKA